MLNENSYIFQLQVCAPQTIARMEATVILRMAKLHVSASRVILENNVKWVNFNYHFYINNCVTEIDKTYV